MLIECRGFRPEIYSKVLLGDVEAPIASASDDRIIVRLPNNPKSLGLTLQVGKSSSDVFPFSLATQLATDVHPVANPVVAPDGGIITTISGARGQQVAQPLVRITRQGDKIPFHCEIMNPTGLAFPAARRGPFRASSSTGCRWACNGRTNVDCAGRAQRRRRCRGCGAARQSGVALRLPPHSKKSPTASGCTFRASGLPCPFLLATIGRAL